LIPTLVIIPVSFFNFLNLIPNVANSFLIGIAANIIVPVISFLIGKTTDKYPEKIKLKKADFKNSMIEESSQIIREKISKFKESEEELIIIEKQFKETLSNQILDIKKQKLSEYIDSIYLKLFNMYSTDIEIRKEYIEAITLIANNFRQYYQYDEKKLEQISDEIKKEAIEPSFKFLENLKEEISNVYEEVNRISFV